MLASSSLRSRLPLSVEAESPPRLHESCSVFFFEAASASLCQSNPLSRGAMVCSVAWTSSFSGRLSKPCLLRQFRGARFFSTSTSTPTPDLQAAAKLAKLARPPPDASSPTPELQEFNYVDKTLFLAEVMGFKHGQFILSTSMRRSGKSLNLKQLKEMALGNRALFEGYVCPFPCS